MCAELRATELYQALTEQDPAALALMVEHNSQGHRRESEGELLQLACSAGIQIHPEQPRGHAGPREPQRSKEGRLIPEGGIQDLEILLQLHKERFGAIFNYVNADPNGDDNMRVMNAWEFDRGFILTELSNSGCQNGELQDEGYRLQLMRDLEEVQGAMKGRDGAVENERLGELSTRKQLQKAQVHLKRELKNVLLNAEVTFLGAWPAWT